MRNKDWAGGWGVVTKVPVPGNLDHWLGNGDFVITPQPPASNLTGFRGWYIPIQQFNIFLLPIY
jgi:hypothetical protein